MSCSRQSKGRLMALNALLVALCALNSVETNGKGYKTVSFGELMNSDRRSYVYSHRNIASYVELTLDTPRNQLLVGARDYVLRLSLTNLTLLEKPLSWMPSTRLKRTCVSRGQTQADCCNYVRVLLVRKGSVFVCGTHAYSPECTWRDASNLTRTTRPGIRGQVARAVCPVDIHQNATALIASSGDLYSATLMARDMDPAILRSFGPSKTLRSVQSNSKWLNEPEFVSSYEIGDFVYFFFREVAVEAGSSVKVVYSRVARVCKNDVGGRFMFEDNWTTFQKARLNCSLPGDYPFYYNHLQSTDYSTDRNTVHAVFTTGPNTISGSAACVYTLSEIERAFSGPFKYQPNANSVWLRSSHSAPRLSCARKSAESKVYNSQQYQLMDSVVQPVNLRPASTVEGEEWTLIAADTVRAKHHTRVDVLFIATSAGFIQKRVRLPGTDISCVVEQLKLFPAGRPQRIKKMTLYKNNLYIVSDSQILQIPTERCHSYKTKADCLNAFDPYCGWHSKQGGCLRAKDGNPRQHVWHQNPLARCPVVHGRWSGWSKWTKCVRKERDETRTSENCLCRSRTCDSPVPSSGGRQCRGSGVEVSQCTVHGGWTNWSDWSGCSATCGFAVRTRRRDCSNPRPQHGGRVCVGQSEQQDTCHRLPAACPKPTESPIDGAWSKWSGWSSCSHKCGRGMHQRVRVCNSPAPNKNGRPCVGNDEEWKQCNIEICPEVTEVKTTSWLTIQTSTDSCIQKRQVLQCRANIEDSLLLNSVQSVERRPCPTNRVTPSDGGSDAVAGGWSAWADWSPCNKKCGAGVKTRHRSCDSPPPRGGGDYCPGSNVENRECNTHSCQGAWSCWSDFSACSVTCGSGTRWRRRHCKSPEPGKDYTKPCLGQSEEKEPCAEPSCTSNDGWTEWTLWSECGLDLDSQVRYRKCHRKSPTHCMGEGTQTRACQPKIGAAAAESRQQETGTKFEAVHLVVVALVTFLFGVVVSVASLYIYYTKVLKKRHDMQPRNTWLKNTNESKPNLYTFPSVPSNIDLNNKYNSYSTGSLNREKMTVKEATLKRDSLMRTNLSLNDL